MTEISRLADTRPDKYEDIIDMPHHVSEKHGQMPRCDRAAQFSPFAALTGYEEAIDEAARITDTKTELDENSKNELDKRLMKLLGRIEEKPVVAITYFKPDERKNGGQYVTVRGCLRGVSSVEKTIILDDGKRVNTEDIINIESDILC